MTLKERARRALFNLYRAAEEEGVEYGTVGVISGDQYIVVPTNRANYINVTLDVGTVVEANDYQGLVSHEGGTRCRLRFIGGEYTIIGPDVRGAAGDSGGTRNPGGGVGPHDHDVGSGREYYHPAELFKPLACAPFDTSSLRVQLYPGFYDWHGRTKALPLTVKNLAAFVPAQIGGEDAQRYAVICADGILNEAVVFGTPATTGDQGDAEIAALGVTARYVKLYAVKLRTGQTTITDIRTLRAAQAYVGAWQFGTIIESDQVIPAGADALWAGDVYLYGDLTVAGDLRVI